MSEHLAAGSAKLIKQTCRKCNRTIYVYVIDGVRYETDTELITIVGDAKPSLTIRGRVMHGGNCLRYQSEAARIKALHEAKRNRPT